MFRRHESKPMGIHTRKEMREMKTISYFNGVWSVMYGMMCNRSDLAHVISVVSRFIEDINFLIKGFEVSIKTFEWNNI